MKKFGDTVNIKPITKSWLTIHSSQSKGPSLQLLQNNDQQCFWHKLPNRKLQNRTCVAVAGMANCWSPRTRTAVLRLYVHYLLSFVSMSSSYVLQCLPGAMPKTVIPSAAMTSAKFLRRKSAGIW